MSLNSTPPSDRQQPKKSLGADGKRPWPTRSLHGPQDIYTKMWAGDLKWLTKWMVFKIALLPKTSTKTMKMQKQKALRSSRRSPQTNTQLLPSSSSRPKPIMDRRGHRPVSTTSLAEKWISYVWPSDWPWRILPIAHSNTYYNNGQKNDLADWKLNDSALQPWCHTTLMIS